MKAYSDNKTVYISDFIKQKHKKRRGNSLEFSYLQLMHYVSTAERQIVKLSSKYVSTYILSTMIKQKKQLHKGILLLYKVLSAENK